MKINFFFQPITHPVIAIYTGHPCYTGLTQGNFLVLFFWANRRVRGGIGRLRDPYGRMHAHTLATCRLLTSYGACFTFYRKKGGLALGDESVLGERLLSRLYDPVLSYLLCSSGPHQCDLSDQLCTIPQLLVPRSGRPRRLDCRIRGGSESDLARLNPM